MALVLIHHGPCKNNKTGKYEFCTVYGMDTPQPDIHPIGFCRENNKKGMTPCDHRTEKEATDCFEEYEAQYFVKGAIDPKDLVYPEKLVPRLEALLVIAKEALIASIEQKNK